MKFVRFSIFIAALSAAPAAPAARADVFDMNKVSCQDFYKSDDNTVTKLVFWLSGYYMGENDDAIIDLDKLTQRGAALVAYCTQHPATSLSDAAEKVMGKK
jgi:acid stress chaperone HdeB